MTNVQNVGAEECGSIHPLSVPRNAVCNSIPKTAIHQFTSAFVTIYLLKTVGSNIGLASLNLYLLCALEVFLYVMGMRPTGHKELDGPQV